MAWDSARPVPWRRFLKEGLLFAIGMTVVMYLFAGERDPASYLGIVMGAVMYICVAALMAKFGYVRKTLAEMRAEAASRPPTNRRATAPSCENATSTQRPSCSPRQSLRFSNA